MREAPEELDRMSGDTESTPASPLARGLATVGAIGLGIAISAALLWWALRGVDSDAVIEALRRTSPPWLLACLGSLALFSWAKASRWRLLLAPTASLRTKDLVPPLVIGIMGNLFLPLQLGEGVRAYLVARSQRIRLVTVLMTLVLERILDLLSALLVIACAFAVAGTLLDAQRDIALVLAAIVGGIVAVAAVPFVAPAASKRLAAAAVLHFPAGAQKRLRDWASAGAASALSFSKPRSRLALAALTLAQSGTMLMCTWASIAALGIRVPATAAFVVMAASIIAMAVPAAPGYFGNIQAAYSIGLAGFGVSAADALAASLVYHSLLVVAFGFSGLVFAHYQRLQWSDWNLSRQVAQVD
jgi:uncharacterized protein (TIRG00374 family)